MSGWQQLMVYCRACQNWRNTLPHKDCTQGGTDSVILLDYGGSLLTCNTCHQVWLIEDTEAVCPVCHQPQHIAFCEDRLYLQPDDQLLATDGPLIYVLVESGTLVVTHRTCLAIGDTVNPEVN